MSLTLPEVLRQYGFPRLVHPNAGTNQLHVTDKTPSGRLPASFSGVPMRSGHYMGGRLGMVVAEGGMGRISQKSADLAAVSRGMQAFHGLSGLGDAKFLDVSVTPNTNLTKPSGGYTQSGSSSSGWSAQNTADVIGTGLSVVNNLIGAFSTSKSSNDGGTSAANEAALRAAQEQATQQWQATQLQLAQQQAQLNAQANASSSPDMQKYLLIGGAVLGGILLLKLLK